MRTYTIEILVGPEHLGAVWQAASFELGQNQATITDATDSDYPTITMVRLAFTVTRASQMEFENTIDDLAELLYADDDKYGMPGIGVI